MTRVVMRRAAYDEIRKSKPVLDEIARRGASVLAAAPDGCILDVSEGSHRARATISTEDVATFVVGADPVVLVSALEAGRR